LNHLVLATLAQLLR